MPSDPIELAPHEVGPWSSGYDAALAGNARIAAAVITADSSKWHSTESPAPDDVADAKILALRERTPKVAGPAQMNLNDSAAWREAEAAVAPELAAIRAMNPPSGVVVPSDPAPPLTPERAREVMREYVKVGTWRRVGDGRWERVRGHRYARIDRGIAEGCACWGAAWQPITTEAALREFADARGRGA